MWRVFRDICPNPMAFIYLHHATVHKLTWYRHGPRKEKATWSKIYDKITTIITILPQKINVAVHWRTETHTTRNGVHRPTIVTTGKYSFRNHVHTTQLMLLSIHIRYFIKNHSPNDIPDSSHLKLHFSVSWCFPSSAIYFVHVKPHKSYLNATQCITAVLHADLFYCALWEW